MSLGWGALHLFNKGGWRWVRMPSVIAQAASYIQIATLMTNETTVRALRAKAEEHLSKAKSIDERERQVPAAPSRKSYSGSRGPVKVMSSTGERAEAMRGVKREGVVPRTKLQNAVLRVGETPAGDLVSVIAALRAAGVISHSGIAKEFNRRGLKTATGQGKWHETQVSRVLARCDRECLRMPSLRIRRTGSEARAGQARQFAAKLAPMIKTIQESGPVSLSGIAAELNRRGVATATGKGKWSASMVWRLLARLK